MPFHAPICTCLCLPCLLLAATIGLPQGTEPAGTTAVRANDFLNSIGTLSAISVRGESLEKTIECARYLGIRWLRAGIEGDVPIPQYIALHMQKGDGTFALVLWNERVHGADTVTVNLGAAHASVEVYDPTIGTMPIQTRSKIHSLTLTLSDHPLILLYVDTHTRQAQSHP